MASSLRIADLAGKRVAIWGFGREGRAAVTAIGKRLPQQALTLYCPTAEASAARLFDASLDVREIEPDASALSAFEIVIKSPGISAYKPALLEAQKNGTRFTSGTALWFGENPQAHVIAVTGTKGKSTTSALIAHLARALGVRTALAGNIGLPPLELLDQTADLWVLELSSFQTSEAGSLALGVITSLYEEHLDWHGTRDCYIADKLKLADAAQQLLINGQQVQLAQRTVQHPHRMEFGQASGWHVADGYIRHGTQDVFDLSQLTLPGDHNALNACAALAALSAIGCDALAAAPALATFRPLPHRLQPLGERDGVRWVNDSISTTPQATLAALASLSGNTVTVLVGGHDRGLDWSDFVTAAKAAPPHAIICNGANGARIAEALHAANVASTIVFETTFDAAVAAARAHTHVGGVVLLSPGAPSFDQFHDYAERGRHFADLAGFDGAAITGIDGLGIA